MILQYTPTEAFNVNDNKPSSETLTIYHTQLSLSSKYVKALSYDSPIVSGIASIYVLPLFSVGASVTAIAEVFVAVKEVTLLLVVIVAFVIAVVVKISNCDDSLLDYSTLSLKNGLDNEGIKNCKTPNNVVAIVKIAFTFAFFKDGGKYL